MKYRKKPVEIEACQFPHILAVGARLKFEDWAHEHGVIDKMTYRGQDLFIQTLEGEMKANPMDYIIIGVAGEVYPCKPEIFNTTYDRV